MDVSLSHPVIGSHGLRIVSKCVLVADQLRLALVVGILESSIKTLVISLETRHPPHRLSHSRPSGRIGFQRSVLLS